MNEALRTYVQSTAFQLTLSRKQIDALIQVNHIVSSGATTWHGLPGEPPRTWDVPQLQQLCRRGLIEHHYPAGAELGSGDPEFWTDKGYRRSNIPISRYYSITRAGQLMLALLAEAGMHTMPALPPPVLAPI